MCGLDRAVCTLVAIILRNAQPHKAPGRWVPGHETLASVFNGEDMLGLAKLKAALPVARYARHKSLTPEGDNIHV